MERRRDLPKVFSARLSTRSCGDCCRTRSDKTRWQVSWQPGPVSLSHSSLEMLVEGLEPNESQGVDITKPLRFLAESHLPLQCAPVEVEDFETSSGLPAEANPCRTCRRNTDVRDELLDSSVLNEVIFEDFNAPRPWRDTVLPVTSRSSEPPSRFWIHVMNLRKKRRELFYSEALSFAPAPAAAKTGAHAAKHVVIRLGWQVLLQPQLVDGPSDSSLAAQPRDLRRSSIALSQQLQLKMLAACLEPEGSPEQQGSESDALSEHEF